MKKYLYTLFLCAFALLAYAQDPAYPPPPVPPLNITAAEYFIDTDPGAGLGTPMALTPGINISNANVAVNVNGLSIGIHYLYIRARNGEGAWSITQVREFLYDQDFPYIVPPPVPGQVVAAEYFIDTDPGAGNGTAIPLTPGVDLNNLPATVHVNGLTNGTHRLYIRTQNAEGRWGLTAFKEFTIDFDIAYPGIPAAALNLVAAEYFFDTDPGTGNGTPIAVTPGTDLNNVNAGINTTGLTVGTHRLYLRSRSQEGNWSITAVKEFTVDADFEYPAPPPAALKVIAAEYFIDTDPGAGLGTSIPVTASIDLANVTANVNTTGLPLGVHRVYLRTKSEEGRWSLTQFGEFTVITDIPYPPAPAPVSNVVAAEYFIDTDPGVGQATAIVIPPGQDIANWSTDINTAGLSNDAWHRLYIRTRNQEGRWSLTFERAFFVGTLAANWTLDPAIGHDYGNVVVNTTSYFDFKIRNTGDLPITLTNATVSNAAFTPAFTAGTVVPAHTELVLKVAFKPTSVSDYAGELKIETNTPNVGAVTTVVSGKGYIAAPPPVMQYLTAVPYNGNAGVNPAVGQPGLYTYKVIYKSSENKAPKDGFPKVGIDLNGDQLFDGLDEGMFTMAKEGSSVDYAAGVVYSYTFNQENTRTTAGYQFFASDADGNTSNSAYKTGPLVSYAQPDLRLFANDITFSKDNPAAGEPFTVFAKISNSTLNAANNVWVKFYNENTPIDSVQITEVPANGSSSVSMNLRFDYDGWFPIKVWVDSSNTLGDINPLNNYAIRPVTVGNPTLPGGITVTSAITVQHCPQLRITVSGKAVYFGTGTSNAVAGAEVTINTGTQLIKTTTNANGDFSYQLASPVNCGNNFVYTVRVTDFTFTSALLTKSEPVPCSPISCNPMPAFGLILNVAKDPCRNVVGQQARLTVKLKHRSYTPGNMWGPGQDAIYNELVKIYKNGVEIQRYEYDGPRAVGLEDVYDIYVPLVGPEPVTLKAVTRYWYNEFFDIRVPLYPGRWIKYEDSASETFTPEINKPDLTISNFRQTKFTTFTFDDENLYCTEATGEHRVRIWDSIPNGSWKLVRTESAYNLRKGTPKTITISDPDMTPGFHYLKIKTDFEEKIVEANENNNEVTYRVEIPKPDLVVTELTPSANTISIGSKVSFKAKITNMGGFAKRFKVGFTYGGTAIGSSKTVETLDEGESAYITSDQLTIANGDKTCAVDVKAIADIEDVIEEITDTNNVLTLPLATDLKPYQLGNEVGSAGIPALARSGVAKEFNPYIRNIGYRSATGVKVRYMLNAQRIGGEEIGLVRAGERFAAIGSFTHTFPASGNYVVQVEADTSDDFCELLETNNIGSFYIKVVESQPDLEVLSQHISPSSLNPTPGQQVTLVGTVTNKGDKASQANVLRFLVDDIQLGDDVPINGILPGKDTTVAATVPYSSLINGVKIMKIVTDPANILAEQREDNNVATRAMIVGPATDMTYFGLNPVSFSPQGFRAGDSVTIAYSIQNKGQVKGSAWIRFMIRDETGSITAMDSVMVDLNGGASTIAKVKMLFSTDKGRVSAEIVGTEEEFDLLNNAKELPFSTIVPLENTITVNGNLDMKAGLPGILPSWIGGKLVLGDYDLIVKGKMTSFDADHFVITNGTGKLKIVNNDAENIFPVGTAEGSSNFVKIANAGTMDNFAVGVVPYVLKNGTSGDTIRNSFVNRTWFIEEEIPGGSNATLSFYWATGHEQPLFDRDQSRSAHYTGSWQVGALGMAVVESPNRYSRTQTGFTSFSPFSVTSSTAILPIRLLEFTVTAKGKSAELAWKSDGEINSKHFVVQHSTNGTQFEDLGIVATNNAAGVHKYGFTHPALSEGTHYYRLKMVDQNGTFTYSEIRWVKMSTQPTMTLYPNPANRMITITGTKANGTIRLLTMDGRLVKQMRTDGTSMVVDVSNLAQGTYIVQYLNEGTQQQFTLIKQ